MLGKLEAEERGLNICVLVLAMHDLGIEPNFGSKANLGSEIPFEPQLTLAG